MKQEKLKAPSDQKPMPTYRLLIFGNAYEKCWRSLTPAQANYWKAQDKKRLHKYLFKCEPEKREEIFDDVPKRAHIKGYWYDLHAAYLSSGPYTGNCVLYAILKRGAVKALHAGSLKELSDADDLKEKLAPSIKRQLKSKYILASQRKRRAMFLYDWNNVKKEPALSNLTLVWSPDGNIVTDALLFGKKADYRNSNRGGGKLEAKVVHVSAFI